ncbi:MAG: addiction module toxin RelE [Anaerolineales bacterium]|nr:MAG: addiction module toxin RelE [Anaerolineales bacterium]
MASKQSFELIYDPKVAQHLKKIDRKYHSLIQRTIEEQLRYEPEVETRNRKPLLRPSAFGTAWEIRFGPNNRFCVFYRTAPSIRKVHILAIGIKVGNRLFIGGEEFEL